MFGSYKQKKNIFDSGDIDEEKYEIEKTLVEKEGSPTRDNFEKPETITMSPRTFESFTQEEREKLFSTKGYLYQLTSSNLFTWVKRYCCLTQDTLFVFKTNKDKRAITDIASASIYRVEALPQWQKKRENCFAIRTYGRTYIFYSVDKLDLEKWISALEESMRDCALDGVAHSFRHLYNANRGDEMKFARIILEKMSLQVPQWNNASTMNTDIKRIMQYMLKDQQENKKTQEGITFEEKVEPWKIEYKFVTLGQKIAEGRFGEVYQGTLWSKTVAIKRLKSKITDKIVEKLKEEASVMSSLRHPNITLFMGICTNQPNVFIVMEYIKNGNMYDVLQNSTIDDKTFFQMLEDIAHGMNYLHQKNILHLDLKPMNLLVDDNYTVKVCDFGLSKTFEEEEKIKGMAGTILYMAPEVINELVYSFKADVFSFGVVLFELLYMREHPEINFTLEDSIGFDCIREPIQRNMNPKVPPWWPTILIDLIFVCLSEDPEKRPTFEEILKVLKTVDDSNDWFIQKDIAKKILNLSKDEKNHQLLLQNNVWGTLNTILLSLPDIEASYFTICAIIELSHLTENQAEHFIEVIEHIEKFTEKNLEEFCSLLSQKGKFKYFREMIDSEFTVLSVKQRIFDIISKIFSSDDVINLFIEQDCIFYFSNGVVNSIFDESLHYDICLILTKIVQTIDNKMLKKFYSQNGIEALIKLAIYTKNHQSQFTALQTLADISVRDFTAGELLTKKGIKPIQLASRAYLAAVMRRKLPEENDDYKSTVSVDPNLQPMMSLKFLRARDQISNIITPEQRAEKKFSRFYLNDKLEDDEVVDYLWEILRKEDDIENISTKDVRLKLEKILNMEIKERKEYVNYQIMTIVGQMDPPTKITDNIYLGSEWNASNKREMSTLGITHILNMAEESPNYFPNELEYLNIRIKDNEDTLILKYFTSCHQFIDNAIDKNKVVLVQCALGISRSATIVVSYLMKKNNWSLQKAYKYVKDLREVVKPNRSFMRQLMEFDVKINGKSSLGVAN